MYEVSADFKKKINKKEIEASPTAPTDVALMRRFITVRVCFSFAGAKTILLSDEKEIRGVLLSLSTKFKNRSNERFY